MAGHHPRLPGPTDMRLITSSFLGIDSLRELAQLFVNGLVNGSAYAVLGIAFALVFGVTKRFHFAFALSYAASAYVAAVVVEQTGTPLVPAILVGLAAGALVGVLCEVAVYGPLSSGGREGTTLLPVFVASLGVTVAGQNVIRLLWGSESRDLLGFPAGTVTAGGVRLSALELALIATAIVLTLLVALLLRSTGLGRQIKAVRSNPQMSIAVGLSTRRVFLIIFVIASLLAGIIAIFTGMRFAVTAEMGIRPVFYAIVVAFLAGVASSPLRVAGTGFGVGTVESLSGLWLNTKLASIVVFALLFGYLTYNALRDGLSRYPLSRVRAAVRNPSRGSAS